MSKFLIDGTNVCGWGKAGSNDPLNLMPLIRLVRELRHARGDIFLCIFDASTRHKLAQGQDRLLDELLKCKDYFAEVTGGVRADDFLLNEADKSGAVIITNDRYREYQPKYPRVADDKRLIKSAILASKLSIPDLDLSEIVPISVDETTFCYCFAPEFDSAVTRVEKVWFDPICRNGDNWGMLMHANVLIRGYQHEKFFLVFLFDYPDGTHITLTDGSILYKYTELLATKYNTRYPDVQIFLPYSTLPWNKQSVVSRQRRPCGHGKE